MSSFLDPKVKPAPPQTSSGGVPGNILMFDGVALDTRCQYCPERNIVLGLCREHSKNINLEVSDVKSVEDIRTALFEPPSDANKVCFGSDATVVAIAPYARSDHYRPVPLVVSASDKTEKGPELALWIRTLLDAYKLHEFGGSISGPIWALGSDGDSTFRSARHIICMTHHLQVVNSDMEIILRSLVGLNLYTSVEGIVGTCDPKHIFKRGFNSKLFMYSTIYILCRICNTSPKYPGLYAI
ncbi:hypothetical protein HYPSUDRAFT_150917 [Hypholoma sublateritium FD-334 SS-4]|uniref:Uncharacterized protein n=1 Tax=Hypholoma sublateritium (strain FD-334 SS-4) TaxID=945553 RepID=A0A0D2N442_HYPSF|nr:hypothetical protein HYPSUDRAFT_150917 [Hypholoma sublateritium FD-334 SS-4]